MKKYLLAALSAALCAGSVFGQDYHYGFAYPRERSVGTLGDGDLTFANDPVFEPSLIALATNEPAGEDWALRLERNQQQYAYTTALGQSTVFNGSYRIEAFFNSDGLSDPGSVYATRQGIVYISSPDGMLLLATTYRDAAGAVRLALVYRNSTGSLPTVYGATPLELGRWYHVEVLMDDQGNDAVANDAITVYLNGAEEIQVSGVALKYLDRLSKISIGYGASTARTFQGAIDEVAVSSSLNEPSLLQSLPNASNAVERIPGMGLRVEGGGTATISCWAPFGGEHNLYFKSDLLETNWTYRGAIAVDDLDWYGEWSEPATNPAGFYKIESTRTTKPYDPNAPATVEDILESGSPYFNPWDTTRWADWYDGSGRLVRPFELNSDIVFDDPGHVWSPDVSVLPDYSPIFELAGDRPVSIEGNGLVLDIRTPELAGKTVSQLYDLSYSEARAIIPYNVYGMDFNQQAGDPASATVSGIAFYGFDKAIQCNHFNRMAGTITNCAFAYNEWGLFSRGTPAFRVEGCTIRCNLLGGVYGEYNSANWVFRNNAFYDNNPVGQNSWGDLVLDACHNYLVEGNQFLGTTEPSKVRNYFTAISLYRNRGEADNVREFASTRHLIRNNAFTGYHIGVDIAVRTGKISSNDKSEETRTYAYDNTFSSNAFTNCKIGFHVVGNRNVFAGNSYSGVEREIALHCPFYKSEGTLLDGEAGTDVWCWGDYSDFSAYAAYLPYQDNAERHVAQADRLVQVATVNGSPNFVDTSDKNFVHAQTLLDGNSMQAVFNSGGEIRDIAVADFDANAPGKEIAVIWNQPISRISTGNYSYADYYSIILYDQTGKEIDRCGRSTLQWDKIAAGNFIGGLGWIHIDGEAEVAAVHSAAQDGKYPVYIFRRGWAEAAVTNQTTATNPVTDLAAERSAGSGYVSLAVARGTTVDRITPSTGSESAFCTLSATPLAIQLGDFDGNPSDGNELAALYSSSIQLYESGSSSPFKTGASGSWKTFAAGEFDGDTGDGDELAVAAATATDGLYPVSYFDQTLTNAFKTQSHSVLAEQARAMASGLFVHGLGPDGYFRRGDGRASFAYEFQPRMELENSGFSPDGQLVASTSTIGFVQSPFDFDGDGSIDDEQAAHLSHANNEYFQLDDSTGFSAPSGSYTIEAFFDAASLPAQESNGADTRRGIFCWYNSHINGSLYLVRNGDELHLEGFVRKGGSTFATANVACTNALAIGRWYHAMLKVFDQGDDGAATDRVELYLDGQLVDTADQVDLEFFTGGNQMRVGDSQNWGTRTFDGELDGVRILAGTDAPPLIDEIPNARAVLGLPEAGNGVSGDHILVLPERSGNAPLYWMHTGGTIQELRTVPILR